MNYFLGIRQTDNVLVADFEDMATGLNHPVAGVTPIAVDSVWHHAAATYDGTTWRLYLDGVLETQLARRRVHAAVRQHPARGARHARSTRRAASARRRRASSAARSTKRESGTSLARRRKSWPGRDQEIPTRDGPARTLGLQRLVRRRARLVRQRPARHAVRRELHVRRRARRSPRRPTPHPWSMPVRISRLCCRRPPSLSGTATDDGVPGIGLTTTWSKVSGPGTVTFGNASALSTTASFSVAGTYVLRLTASDGLLSTQRRPDDHGHRRRESGARRQRGSGSGDHAARQPGLARRHRHRRRPAGHRAHDDVEQGQRTRNGDVWQRRRALDDRDVLAPGQLRASTGGRATDCCRPATRCRSR